jgi:hypothetical protein
MDTRGYIYDGTFYPSSPSTNLIQENDDGAGNSQFLLTVTLQAGVAYTLVVTSFSEDVSGSFSVHASGPSSVSMTRMNIY